MAKHPYIGLPDDQFWRRASGFSDYRELDPVGVPPFSISAQEKIVTLGSCFAQHVAHKLSTLGFNHFITEAGHPVLPPTIRSKFNYGMFSARYGNVYTVRQLSQLIARAYGEFIPLTVAWESVDGSVVDPFRPQIQPGGFVSHAELESDRISHFAAVRQCFEEAEVLVFTLGLTEAWIDKRDGAVFPIAPGVAGGTFSEDIHAFYNFDETETSAELLASLSRIRQINPKVKIILTVSPVPLNATFESRHVLVSTTWSKAVLRVAAERAARSMENVCYFPSYEIITAPVVRGRYFAEDAREVLPAGVEHVMQTFFRHFSPGVAAEAPVSQASLLPVADAFSADMERTIAILCDEESIRNE